MAKQVLIVDDDPDIREALQAVLELDGHVVTALESGAAVLELLRRCPFDLILLDVMMPGIDGLEVLRQVRRAEVAVPVYLLTAMGGVRHIAQALGAQGTIMKPWSVDELLALVAQVPHG